VRVLIIEDEEALAVGDSPRPAAPEGMAVDVAPRRRRPA